MTQKPPHRPRWALICLSFFAGAVLAGYFSPKVEGIARQTLSSDVDRPAVKTIGIAKLDTPFNRNNPDSRTVPGKTSPVQDGEAGAFIRSMSAHVYYDPPHQLENLSFQGPDEKPVALSDFRGRYVLMNLWATWCGYCITELPSLQRLKERYAGKGLDVVAVSVDTDESIPSLASFLKNRGLGEVALNYDDRGDVQFTLPVNVLPVSFLIDPQGRVLYSFGGATDWASLPALAFLERFAPLNQ
jgi:thiol-disulfide isomerase/thioredoxin